MNTKIGEMIGTRKNSEEQEMNAKIRRNEEINFEKDMVIIAKINTNSPMNILTAK